jgi:hypothetical protein
MLSTVRVTMRTAALLSALALLGGCGDDGGDGGSASAGGSAALSDPITFQIIGGDAFRDDTVTVQPDGAVRVETRAGEHSGKLSSDELTELSRAVAQADLARIESAPTQDPQPDAVGIGLTYRGKQVEMDIGEMPERLAPLVKTFVELIDEHGP